MRKDYYVLLGVSPNATLEEIKSAYCQRALELPPDQSGGSSNAFLEVHEAYTVLGNPARRATYEGGGVEIPVVRSSAPPRSRPVFSRGGGVEPLQAPPAAEPFREISLLNSYSAFHPSFDELFDRIWSNFSSAARPKGETAQSLTVDLFLSPEEARRGGEVRILVPARTECPACFGYGRIGLAECRECAGQGDLLTEYPLMVGYPPGITSGHVAHVDLNRFGIANLYLVLRFRVTADRM